MGEYTYLLIIGILVITVVYHFAKKALMNKYSNQLMELIINNKEQEFIELLDSKIVKYIFAPFNREYMRLNMYIMNNKTKQVVDQVALIKKMTLVAQQKLSAYKVAFQYFISIKNEKHARSTFKIIKDLVNKNEKLNAEIIEECEMEIKIVFDKDLSTISYIDENIAKCSESEKVAWLIKKAILLKKHKKLEEAIACIEKTLEYTSDDDEKEIIRELIESKLENLK